MSSSKQPLLPYSLRIKVWNLIQKEKTTHQIADEVYEQSKPFVKSKNQLIRCIAAIRGKHTKRLTPVSTRRYEPPAIDVEPPRPKQFLTKKYKAMINKLRKNTPGTVIEKSSERIAIDILKNYEGFDKIEKGPDFIGTPFDFFGFKDGEPHIIELKSSLHYFQAPGETQKRRMRQLLDEISALRVGLLQLALKKGQYRILYDREVRGLLFTDREAPIESIREWIRERI